MKVFPYAVLALFVAGCANVFQPELGKAPVEERTSVANGGEKFPWDHGRALFLGDRPKTVCLQQPQEFATTKQETADAFMRAHKTLVNYIETNRLNDLKVAQNGLAAWIPRLGGTKYATGLQSIPPERKLSIGLERVDGKEHVRLECQGNEDLILKVAYVDASVEADRKQFRNHPGGFMQPIFYNPHEGWGRAYIYIDEAEIRSSVSPIRAIESWLLHELLHVFGCEDVPGTIMDEKAFAKQVADAKDPASIPLAIDGEFRKLYTCVDCPIDRLADSASLNGIVKILSAISVLTPLMNVRLIAPKGLLGHAALKLEDEHGEFLAQFSILYPRVKQQHKDGPVFKRAWMEDSVPFVAQSFSEQTVYDAYLATDYGIKVPISIEPMGELKGLNAGGLSITAHTSKGHQTLFESIGD